MALSSASVWEIRTAGAATNGGGFVTGAAGTDYSQQDAKNTVGNNISTTDAVAVGTGVITSATATFTSAIVGNIIYLQGGTGALAAGWYQVTARASTTSITIDRSVAAGTGITMNIGGANSDPAIVAPLLVATNTVYQKAGTYTITSASTNVAGGCVAVSVRVKWEGYQTTRGDLGTKPIYLASGISTFTLFSATGLSSAYRNLEFDGAALTSSRGFAQNSAQTYNDLLTARNCTNSGFALIGTPMYATRLFATGCTTAGAAINGSAATAVLTACEATGNTVTGISTLGSVMSCLSWNNTGATTDGILTSVAKNCTSYGNGRDGYRTTLNGVYLANCIAEANGAFGFNDPNTSASLLNCAGFNNTSGATSGVFVFNAGFVTGTASFFTNAVGGDFSLNNTASAGASARAAGIPGVFPGGLTTGYLDIGAAQHADPASSGGYVPQVFE